eukprot:542195-Karenia_brevis.AAC.1
MLSQRFDIKTSSSMLAKFLEAVSPKSLKEKDLIAGIHKWERKSADLMTRSGEEIRGNLRLAVF